MQLIPIGRFSQLTRLSVKALRLYDQMGVLSPARVDEDTGYRYYSMAQVNRAAIIRLLRQGDMPLEEIRSLLEEADAAMILQRLRLHRDRIERRMQETQSALDLLEGIVEREDGFMAYEVNVKELPDQPVLRLRVRTTMGGIGEAMGAAFCEFGAHITENNVLVTGPPICIYAEEMGADAEGEMWVCFPAPADAATSDRVERAVIPGGSVAWTLHRGPYDGIGPAYAAIYAWMEEHGRQPAGPMRDVYLTDPEAVPPAEYLTEVQWPIA